MPATLPAHVSELSPSLWRWTAPHPDWQPGAVPDTPADWEEWVGSVLFSGPASAVFFDPLLPREPAEFWDWADAVVAGRPVHVLTTIHWHRRNRGAFVTRYRAATSSARSALPAGVESVRLWRARETLYWLASERALVVGDAILGARGAGGLRLSPDPWLRLHKSGIGQAELKEELAPVLELPVERVLISHGEPVLHDGARALAELLGER